MWRHWSPIQYTLFILTAVLCKMNVDCEIKKINLHSCHTSSIQYNTNVYAIVVACEGLSWKAQGVTGRF